MRHVRGLLAILLASLPTAAACRQARSVRTAPAPADKLVRGPTYVLNPGALVRVRLADRRVVTGSLLRRFTPDSHRVVVCEAASASCAGQNAPGAREIPVNDVRRLSVRGRATGFGFYMGVYGGALVGGVIHGSAREPNDRGMALGMVVGAALGTAIGSRVRAWELVFPCAHACATGEYPGR